MRTNKLQGIEVNGAWVAEKLKNDTAFWAGIEQARQKMLAQEKQYRKRHRSRFMKGKLLRIRERKAFFRMAYVRQERARVRREALQQSKEFAAEFTRLIAS